MDDIVIEAPASGALISAGCNVCRKLLLTQSPERAIKWGLEHAHTGNLMVAELIAYQD